MKKIAWWVVFALGLGGAYAYGQGNARWYRQTPAHLDDITTVEVIGDALTDTCYAVVVVRETHLGGWQKSPAVATLGVVPCRKAVK